MSRINKDITRLNIKLIEDSSKEHLSEAIEELNLQLQEELTKLAESWLIQSKT